MAHTSGSSQVCDLESELQGPEDFRAGMKVETARENQKLTDRY